MAVLVRIEGGPGVLFKQSRIGLNGEAFVLLKLRSLKPADVRESDTTWSVADDNRIGSIGRFMRRTSLDELPQLWNILRGDMSLVGPRPERPHFVYAYSSEYPEYLLRHRVPSGLTGLAQINGLRGNTSIEDRIRYDNYYIENWSLWLDLKILLTTLRAVVCAQGR
jgi:lipopolysaccharide/colanic/teichoic acid biosynthesis glycosyltransferase